MGKSVLAQRQPGYGAYA